MELKRSNILLSVISILSLCLMFVGYAILSETLTISGTVIAYQTYNGVVLDGYLDDSIYTTDVKKNYISHNRDDGFFCIDVYATRTNKDLFFVAEYYTRIPDLFRDGLWWQQDNIEFWIVDSNNGYVTGKKHPEHPNEAWPQWYITTQNGGSSTFTKHFVSEPVYNSETGYYLVRFEWAIAYSDITLSTGSGNPTESTDLGFSLGANPKGNNWYKSFNFQDTILGNNYKITKQGIYLTGNLVGDKPIIANTETYHNGHYPNVVVTTMDGTQDFEVQYEFRAQRNVSSAFNYHGQYCNCCSWVADIYSPGWSSGGWSMRSDWCGWGKWHDAGSPTYWDTGQSFQTWEKTIPTNLANQKLTGYNDGAQDMNVSMNVKFTASTGQIVIDLYYKSNVSKSPLTGFNYSNLASIHLTYRCKAIHNGSKYNGNIIIGVGGQRSIITMNSVFIKKGNYIAPASKFETINGEIISYGGSVTPYVDTAFANEGTSAALIKTSSNGALATFTQGTYKMKINGTLNGPTGLIFNYSENECYRFYADCNNLYAGQRKVIIEKLKDGKITRISSNYFTAEYDSNKQYVFKVVKVDNKAYCYINDNLYGIIDDVGELSGNKIGIIGGSRFSKFQIPSDYLTNDVSLTKADTLIIGHSYMEKWKNEGLDQGDLAVVKNDCNLGNILNIGVGGSVAKHWEELKEVLPTYGANKVIYVVGINEINDGATPEMIIENISKLLVYMKEQNPNLEVALATINHTYSTKDSADKVDRIERTNDYIRSLCYQYDWIKLVETEYLYCSSSSASSVVEGNFTDGLHLTAASYDKLATEIGNAFKGLNQPTSYTNESTMIANYKDILKAQLSIYSQYAYTADYWVGAEQFYNEAINLINECNTLDELIDLNLDSYKARLDEIVSLTDEMYNEFLDPNKTIAWETDEFTKTLESTTDGGYNFMFDGHRLNNSRVFTGDISLTFTMSNINTKTNEVGLFLRANQSSTTLGVTGYYINFRTPEDRIEVYYLYDHYGLGTTFNPTGLGSCYYRLEADETTFRVAIVGNYLYVYEYDDYLSGGSNAYLLKVNLSNYLISEGSIGILSWDKDYCISGKITLDNIVGEHYVNNSITFVTNGGLHIDDMEIPDVVEQLPIPTRYGYEFAGWYADSHFDGDVYTTTAGITGHITLYAKWEKITYLYMYYGDLLDYERYVYQEGDVIKLNDLNTLCNPSRLEVTDAYGVTHYGDFLYWAYEGADEYSHTQVTSNITVGNEDIILVAVYDRSDIPPVEYFTYDKATNTYESTGKVTHEIVEAAKYPYSYTVDVSFRKNKEDDSAVGTAFRMDMSHVNYQYEKTGDNYIAVGMIPLSGGMQISRVLNGSWARLMQNITLDEMPLNWKLKYNNSPEGYLLTVKLAIVDYGDSFDIYLDNILIYSYTNTTELNKFTGMKVGFRSSTVGGRISNPTLHYGYNIGLVDKTTNITTNTTWYAGDLDLPLQLENQIGGWYTDSALTNKVDTVDFTTNKDLTLYGANLHEPLHYFTDNGSGTYSVPAPSNGKAVKNVMLLDSSAGYNYYQIDTTATFKKNSSDDGAIGPIWRANFTGDYQFEKEKISYISADISSMDGSLLICFVFKNVYYHLTSTGEKIPLEQLPSAWQSKYNNAAQGATVSFNIKVKDYGEYFEVYIDNDLAFGYYNTQVLSYASGNGVGLRATTLTGTLKQTLTPMYKVSFVDNTGTEFDSYYAKKNENISSLPYFTKTNNLYYGLPNKVVTGWYTTQACTTARTNFNITVTADTTIYGKWRRPTNKYTITGSTYTWTATSEAIVGEVTNGIPLPGYYNVYEQTIKFTKGNGSRGFIFRAKIYSDSVYEDTTTSYIAVQFQNTGNLLISYVEYQPYLPEGKNTKWHSVYTHKLEKLPESWQNKYNNNTEITTTLKIVDHGGYFLVYIDGELAYTYGEAGTENLDLYRLNGRGYGIRSSGAATYSNMTYKNNRV